MKIMRAGKFWRQARSTAKAATVVALCLVIATPEAVADGSRVESSVPASAKTGPLTQQEKVLHALNRLTFGPKPGDEAAVSRMGLEAWFEQQLHPERIDDAAFEQRLDGFPAMKLSTQQLIERFPSPQRLKAMDRMGTPLPSDPVERAIYADSEAAYDAQLKKLAAGAPVGAGAQGQAPAADASMQVDASMAGPPMSPSARDMRHPDVSDASMLAKGKGKRKNSAEPMAAGDVQAVLDLPAEQRVQRLLAMSPQEMMSFQAGLKPFERVRLMQGLAPGQMEIVAALQGPVRVVGAEALETRLLRDVYSDRQLQAVMTDFWLNHFSVYVRKNQNEPYLLSEYQRDVILPRALGKFEDLLVATAKSPAMLMYLDNWQSIGPNSVAATRVGRIQKFAPNAKLAQALPKGINENYARELMELHTLGVNGGYTQQDVINVAKCFTGWTIEKPYQGGGGNAVFDETRHEPGPKVVLGKTIEENGGKEGIEVLHMLATSPATAHFISQKLAVRFVSDAPPAALVDRMTATFVKSDGDIKAVLSTMFHSPEFWSPAVYRAKVKTPIEFMVSALRASEADVKNPLPLVQAMATLGMPIYGMQTPNGYSWKADEWVSSNALISRMNFSLVLSGGRLPGTRTDFPALLGDAAAAPSAETEVKLEALLLGQPAAARTRSTVLAEANDPTAQATAEKNFKGQSGDADMQDASGGAMLVRAKAGRYGREVGFAQAGPETPLDTMAGLLLGSPDFQRR